jgi:hypothetical protein
MYPVPIASPFTSVWDSLANTDFKLTWLLSWLESKNVQVQTEKQEIYRNTHKSDTSAAEGQGSLKGIRTHESDQSLWFPLL